MKIKQVMKKKLISANQDDTIIKGIHLLITNKVSGIAVLDDLGNLAGVFSEKDAFKALFPKHKDWHSHTGYVLTEKLLNGISDKKKKIPIKQVMSKRIVTINIDDPIKKAASLMLLKNVNRLPVIENSKIVGIISRRDIYQAILRKEIGL